MKVILSDDVGRRAERPKMAFFCVVGRFRVRTLQFTAKNKKGRQNEKKWRFGVVGRPFAECARPLVQG